MGNNSKMSLKEACRIVRKPYSNGTSDWYKARSEIMEAVRKGHELYKPTDTEPRPCEECKFQGDISFCDVCCHNYMSMFADKMQEVNADECNL